MISANLGVLFTTIGRSQDAKKHGEIKSNHKKMYGYNAIMLLYLSLVFMNRNLKRRTREN